MKKRFHINLDDSAFTKERSPPKSHFQPSSKGGQTSSTPTASTSNHPDECLSYAQYIVQSKNTAAAPPRTDGPPEPLNLRKKQPDSLSSTTGHGLDCADASETPQNEIKDTLKPDPTDGNSNLKSDPSFSLAPKPVGSGNSIIVSPRQRGNPILKFVRTVPWEFADIVPDYVLGQTTCALFLSLRYHSLNPNYIHDRLKQLGQTFTLRVLLVQVDVKDPHHSLKELARICILADCTLILAWSPEEAGRYLETYKSYEKKPVDLLKEQVDKDYLSKITDCLTTVKSINKTDAITLLSTFSSIEGIICASKEDLVLCPGLGPQKARRLYDVLHKPFLKSKTKDD